MADIDALTAKLAVQKQATTPVVALVISKAIGFTGYLVASCSGFVMIILADIAALTAKLAVQKQAITQGSNSTAKWLNGCTTSG